MKRSTKMVLLLMVTVALCCGYLAVQNFSQKESVETADTDYPLLNGQAVTAMTWFNGEEFCTLETAGDIWTLAGNADFPVEQDMAQDMADGLEALTADRQLTGVESLSDYGLEEPVFTVTVALADGSEVTISQGNENSLAEQVYVQISGDDTVYMVDDAPADIFDLSMDDLMAVEELGEVADISVIVLKTPTTEHTFRREDGETARYIEAETGKLLDTELVETFASDAAAIQWSGVVSYSATDEELVAYGLDDPVTSLYITSVEETEDADGEPVITTHEFSLLLGGFTSDSSGVYAMIDGGRMIYTIAEADANPIFEALQGSLESDQALAVNWDELTEMTLMMGGDTVTVEKVSVEVEVVAEDSDAEETEIIDQWQIDGAAVDAELMERAIGLLAAMETSDDEESSAAGDYLTLAFVEADGNAVTMTLTDDSADAYGVSGEAKTVPAATIDEVVRLIRHMK